MKLKRLGKKVLAKFIKTKSVTFDNLTLKGAFEDYGVLKAIGNEAHEQFFKALFLKELQGSGDVVDIGAHLGKYSLLAGSHLEEGYKVYSFEPHPRTFTYLRQNVVENGLQQKVQTFNLAISDQDGSASLNADLLQSDFTSLAAVRDPNEVNQVAVKTRKLISVVPDCLPRVLKIDVEGAECLVLDGINDTIQRARRSGLEIVLFIEANSDALGAFSSSPAKLAAKIKELGFKSIKKIDEDQKALVDIQLENSQLCENWLCS